MSIIYLTPVQAFEKLNKNKNILFVDVRSYAEYKFVGYATNSVLLPWIDEPDCIINPRFCQAIGNLLIDRTDPLTTEIILICRSGNRSNEAGNALLKKGFSNIAHVNTGFEGDIDSSRQRGNINGWRYDGLPWEQC